MSTRHKYCIMYHPNANTCLQVQMQDFMKGGTFFRGALWGISYSNKLWLMFLFYF